MISYFATIGRGTGEFVGKELDSLIQHQKLELCDGKVFWQTEESLQSIQMMKALRSVERLFICVTKEAPLPQRNGFKVLKDQLNKSKELFQSSACLWNLHQNENYKTDTNSKPDRMSPPCKRKKPNPESTSSKQCNNQDDSGSHPNECGTSSSEVISRDIALCDSNAFTFRVSCKVSGLQARNYRSQELGKFIGVHLSRMLGWNIDLRNPTFEVYVHMNDEGTVIGLPLSKKPLSLRPYIKHIGLRSTVAWAIAFSADLRPGDVILDPMCGCATILLEAASSWPDVYCIGCDIDAAQVRKAEENIALLPDRNIQLLKADVCNLPMVSESIDKVLCDMPFGQNHSTESEMIAQLPTIMASLNRVLRNGGKAVLLTSSKLKDHLLQCVQSIRDYTPHKPEVPHPEIKQPDSQQMDKNSLSHSANIHWEPEDPIYLKLGETHAYMCIFNKLCDYSRGDKE